MIYAKGGEHSVQAVGHQNRAAAGVRQVLQLPDLLGQGQHLPNHRAQVTWTLRQVSCCKTR